MMKHLFFRRALAMTLSAAMVLGGTPVTVMGRTAIGMGGEITGFDKLPSRMVNQEVEVGADLSDVTLPDALTATVRLEIPIEDRDSEEPEEENIGEDIEEEVPDAATSSSAIRICKTQGDSDGMEIVETIVSIPVTWEAEPEFDGQIPGIYGFTPELPSEYTLAEDTEIPAVTVTVKGSAVSGRIMGTVMTLASGTDWSLDNDGTLTISSNMGMSGCSVYLYSHTEDAAQVKNAVIEDGVTKINPFYGCKNMIQITIPDTVTTIGQQAFAGCISLESVTLPPALTTIEVQMFQGCKSLSSVIIPESVTVISNYAFGGCTALEEITIPDSVENLNAGAFDGCTALKEITIPDSVENLISGAFSGCTGLTEVTFENPVPPAIGTNIFYNCSKLKAIYVPADSTDAYKTAANMSIYADKINPIVIDNGWTLDTDGTLTIKSDAGMANWSSVYLLDEARSAVKAVNIQSGVTNIGNTAFYNCTSLTEIEIPAGVTDIGYNAFYNCSALASIEIPSDVANIDQYVFATCGALKTVTFKGAAPPEIGIEIFYDCPLNAIYVPAGSAGAYKAVPNLAPYKDLIFELKEEVINTANTGSVTYNGALTDLTAVSGLFTVDSNAGARTYTVESGGTGAGAISGSSLTVTRAGTIRIGLETAETDTHHAGAKVIATLTVNKGNPECTCRTWQGGCIHQ